MASKVRALTPITALIAAAFGAIGGNARPVTDADGLPVRLSGRAFSIATGKRTAFVTAQTRVTLPTLGASRVVRALADQACLVKFGDVTVTAAIEDASFPIAANQAEMITVPAGATHYSIIRLTADGTIHLTPLA